MTDIANSIIEELTQYLEESSQRVFECYATEVRSLPTRGVTIGSGAGFIPFQTGELQDSIGLRGFRVVNAGTYSQEITVGARSDDGFDYPTHLDLGSGIHSGWWEAANQQAILEDCCDRNI